MNDQLLWIIQENKTGNKFCITIARSPSKCLVPFDQFYPDKYNAWLKDDSLYDFVPMPKEYV